MNITEEPRNLADLRVRIFGFEISRGLFGLGLCFFFLIEGSAFPDQVTRRTWLTVAKRSLLKKL